MDELVKEIFIKAAADFSGKVADFCVKVADLLRKVADFFANAADIAGHVSFFRKNSLIFS